MRKMLEEFARSVERMLFEQLLWMHGRIIYLQNQCCIEGNARVMEIAMTDITRWWRRRGGMRWRLAEYLDKKRRSFTSVKQANIAQQQVVANVTSGLANHAIKEGGIVDASAKKEKVLAVRGNKRGIAQAGLRE